MKSDDEIRKNLFFLEDYHKYRLSTGMVNPNRDRITSFILNLKDPTHSYHTQAVQFFGRRLLEFLPEYIQEDELVHAAIVPSHSAGNVSGGLIGVIRHAQVRYKKLSYPRNPLNRHTTVAKLTSGGPRGESVHLNSIHVDKKIIKPGDKILLLDDVSTTGNSISACEKLLYEAGADLVLCVALAQTVQED